ncbi:uncharacterized protein LOC129577235 isoform X2 [Sitodiplosis mosellana]|uniref:uncharacterized protein LOC129577235 isoform X2 n=1 Tax=Sitodiplosis mosellana TaxID=263140 RepID=UPI0024450FB0|nr:uncharacterized protein LOC129577235 isoform X2 [Sitodiplosis mosellana]
MYSMSSVRATEHPITSKDMNQNPYTTPLIKPSMFSSSHHEHQPYESVVNPELPILHPNVFQLPTTSTQPLLLPQSAFSPLNMPQNGAPWKCPEWMANQNIQPGSYMSFNGLQSQQRLPFKRKAAPDMDLESIQSKQLITEEKMAAHLDGLHISSEFKAHDINQTTKTNEAFDVDSDSSDSFISYPANLQDIEEKLKRAQKIVVADVVKSIQEEPLLPAAILERFEKPCKALVIWQPPQRLTDMIVSKASQEQQQDDDENADNNNVDLIDANNDLQMDMDS